MGLPMPEKHYLECECGCCVLSVYHDDWDDYTAFVWLVIHGHHFTGWKDRIRQAWYVLKTGHPLYTWEILLRKEAALELAGLLQEHAEDID